MTKLRVLDLFSGIGGFSLGLERATLSGAKYDGFETVAFCEIEDFPCRVLAKHWPDVPCYRDVRQLTGEQLRADGVAVDVICGGFPCQPFSSASRGRRVATDLWPEMRRVVSDIRPRIVVAENVGKQPIGTAVSDLGWLGYSVWNGRMDAGAIGADHSRARWWLCAYADDQGQLYRAFDAEMAGLSKVRQGFWQRPYQPQRLRVSDGLPDRVDRLKALGNAVVPQIPEMIGNAILCSLNASNEARAA